MIEKLKANGWVMYYSCNCGGSLKQYWRNKNFKGWEIVIRPTKNTAYVRKNNSTAAGPIWLYQLEAKMTEYAING